MRRDSPACGNCNKETGNLTEDKIIYSSFGIISGQPVRYLLELNLNTKINVKTSYFEEESLGTIFFNLEK